jgi:hypothetical protein
LAPLELASRQYVTVTLQDANHAVRPHLSQFHGQSSLSMKNVASYLVGGLSPCTQFRFNTPAGRRAPQQQAVLLRRSGALNTLVATLTDDQISRHA